LLPYQQFLKPSLKSTIKNSSDETLRVEIKKINFSFIMNQNTKAEIALMDRFTFDQYMQFSEYIIKQIEQKITQ
jgi:hypothetical protein